MKQAGREAGFFYARAGSESSDEPGVASPDRPGRSPVAARRRLRRLEPAPRKWADLGPGGCELQQQQRGIGCNLPKLVVPPFTPRHVPLRYA